MLHLNIKIFVKSFQQNRSSSAIFNLCHQFLIWFRSKLWFRCSSSSIVSYWKVNSGPLDHLVWLCFGRFAAVPYFNYEMVVWTVFHLVYLLYFIKISIRYMEVYGYKVTQCEKVQGEWILLLSTLSVNTETISLTVSLYQCVCMHEAMSLSWTYVMFFLQCRANLKYQQIEWNIIFLSNPAPNRESQLNKAGGTMAETKMPVLCEETERLGTCENKIYADMSVGCCHKWGMHQG